MQSNWVVGNVGDIDREHSFFFYMGHVRLNAVCVFFCHFLNFIENGAERNRKGIKPIKKKSVERDTPAPLSNCIIIDKIRTSKSTLTQTCNNNSIHCQLNVKHARIWLPPAIYCLTPMDCQNRRSIRFGHWVHSKSTNRLKTLNKAIQTIKRPSKAKSKNNAIRNELNEATGFDFIYWSSKKNKPNNAIEVIATLPQISINHLNGSFLWC